MQRITKLLSTKIGIFLQNIGQSIVDNIRALPDAFSNPVLASAPDSRVNAGVYGVMSRQFASQASVFAYLLFILLYIPCVSTIAVIRKELNVAWACFAMAWSIGLAYGVSIIAYQLLSWRQHPTSSMAWVCAMILAFFGVCFALLRYASTRYARVEESSLYMQEHKSILL